MFLSISKQVMSIQSKYIDTCRYATNFAPTIFVVTDRLSQSACKRRVIL